MSDTNSLFRNRRFMVVWLGQTVSGMGDRLFSLALMWWVVRETGSGAAMSAVALAAALPRIMLGPFAGVYADRLDRRTLMLVSNLVNAAVTAVVAVLFWKEIFSLTVIVATSAVIGLVSTFHSPAFEATIPAVVSEEQLVRANSIMQTSYSVIGIVTPALSGILLAATNVGTAIFIDAMTFAVAGISLLLITLPLPEPQAEPQRVWRDAATGFKFIFRHSLLFPMLLLFAVINLTLAPIGITVPVLIVQVIKSGPALMGLFGSAQSAGVLVSSSLVSLLPGLLKRTGTALLVTIASMGAVIAALGLWPSAVTVLAAGFGIGFFAVAANIASQTIWQREVPSDIRGRVFAARRTLSVSLQPLGMALAGPLSDLLGVTRLLAFSGSLCLIGGLAGFVVPGLASYPSKASAEEKPLQLIG